LSDPIAKKESVETLMAEIVRRIDLGRQSKIVQRTDKPAGVTLGDIVQIPDPGSPEILEVPGNIEPV
jgi:hypothetical protein